VSFLLYALFIKFPVSRMMFLLSEIDDSSVVHWHTEKKPTLN
jgi:hypothetical protein